MQILTLAVLELEEDVISILDLPFAGNAELVEYMRTNIQLLGVPDSSMADGKYIAMLRYDPDGKGIQIYDIEPYTMIQL
jgi:hypothetical protein